ncbi:MAG: hypothetical protein NC299_04720 [Lachnospiraceae bacterium]|nr:hypothetical protein [Ruminococcus sp.]MCM1274652.1 hypothetical protein [Lachnospiraceae bacterium]
MKKFAAFILTSVIFASLTACSRAEDNGGGLPDEEKLINVTAPAAADEKPDEAPDGNESAPTENGDEQAPESEPEESDDNESAPESAATDDDKADADSEPTEPEKPSIVLPLKDLPDGSYFTYDGKPCEDHSDCDWSGDDCNCVKFDRAIQAVGFAKYVYFEVTGRHVSLDDRVDIDLDMTAESARSCLMGVPVGTYIAAETNNELFHTMIAAASDKDGITVYQANYGGGCRVSLMTFTWREFADRFPHLDYYIK